MLQPALSLSLGFGHGRTILNRLRSFFQKNLGKNPVEPITRTRMVMVQSAFEFVFELDQ